MLLKIERNLRGHWAHSSHFTQWQTSLYRGSVGLVIKRSLKAMKNNIVLLERNICYWLILQNYKIYSIVFKDKQFTFNKHTGNEGNNKHNAHKEGEGFI